MSWGQLFLILSQHPVLAIGGLVFLFAARIALYAKAGHSFLSALIPFYAEWTFARIAGAPGLLGLLLWVPVLNVLAWFALNFGLARRFGRSPLFALGLVFVNPVFMPVLAFGSSRYRLAG
jgi:hypothetical protein